MNLEEVRWVRVLHRNVSGGGKLLLLTWLVPKYTQTATFPRHTFTKVERYCVVTLKKGLTYSHVVDNPKGPSRVKVRYCQSNKDVFLGLG